MKKLVILIFVISLVFSGSFSASAKEKEEPSLDSYLDGVYDAVPEEAKPYLEKEYSSDNLDSEEILSLVEAFLPMLVKGFLSATGELLVLIVFAAIVKKLNDALAKNSAILELVSFLLLIVYLIKRLLLLAEETYRYTLKIQSFMSVISITLGGVAALGGNLITSGAMTATLSSVAFVLETFCLAFLLPTVRLSLVSLIAPFSEQNGFLSVGKITRSLFQSLMGVISFFSVTVLTCQSVIAQSEDTLSARTVRYALNGSVPIVGSVLGDSLRTLTASVNMIRRTVGALGVMTVIVLALFPVVSMLGLKFAVFIMESVSESLGLGREQSLLCEARKLLNMLIAVIFVVSLLYIFSLALFMLLPLAQE